MTLLLILKLRMSAFIFPIHRFPGLTLENATTITIVRKKYLVFAVFRAFFSIISWKVLKIKFSKSKLCMSLAIKQKGKSQNWCYKKTKQDKFSEKQIFLTPDTHMHVSISGGKKCSFFGKSSGLCFLVILILGFTLLPYYRVWTHFRPVFHICTP